MSNKEIERVKRELTESINQSRFAMLELEQMRTPTLEDIVIIQRNLADQILSIKGLCVKDDKGNVIELGDKR